MVPTQAGSTSWGAVQLTLNAPAEKIYDQDGEVRSFENTTAWIVTNGTASIMPGTVAPLPAQPEAVLARVS